MGPHLNSCAFTCLSTPVLPILPRSLCSATATAHHWRPHLNHSPPNCGPYAPVPLLSPLTLLFYILEFSVRMWLERCSQAPNPQHKWLPPGVCFWRDQERGSMCIDSIYLLTFTLSSHFLRELLPFCFRWEDWEPIASLVKPLFIKHQWPGTENTTANGSHSAVLRGAYRIWWGMNSGVRNETNSGLCEEGQRRGMCAVSEVRGGTLKRGYSSQDLRAQRGHLRVVTADMGAKCGWVQFYCVSWPPFLCRFIFM